MKRLMAGTLAVAASLAITATASAAPKTFWFNCTGATPVQTIDVDSYSWSDTAPTAGVQDGAGCGWLDSGLVGTNQPNPLYDAAFGGEYAGGARKAEITIYGSDISGVTDKTSDFIITADGEEVYKGMLVPTVGAGPVQGISAYTFTIPAGELKLESSNDPKQIVIAVAGHWLDTTTPGWYFGAKEVPSNIKLIGFDDLTAEEQTSVLCMDDETQCPAEEGEE